jgi:hypothetical protein
MMRAMRRKMTKEAEYVVDCARLVLLGWLGDGMDGADAMYAALGKLRLAFDAYDKKPQPRIEERALIVAWLRKQRPEGSGAWDYADGIEKGEHLKASP